MSVRLNHNAGQMRERERYIQQFLVTKGRRICCKVAVQRLHYCVPVKGDCGLPLCYAKSA
jgi:hypothetical protein